MKKTFLVLMLVTSFNSILLISQDLSLDEKVNILNERTDQHQIKIQKIYDELNKEYRTYRNVKKDLNQAILTKQEQLIDSLNILIDKSNQNLASINSQLDDKIKRNGQKAENQFAELDTSVGNNRILGILGTLAAFIIGGLIYMLLGKRISSSKTDVETQIRKTKASLEEESVKLDNKLVEVLETQLKLKQVNATVKPKASNEKADHSLALKVADEIVRMQKNISRMDEGAKGIKPLLKGIERIQANFASNGYEMVNMLGQEYNEGMKATVSFVQDENFDTNRKIITRIIKPQVNYKGTMIQAAQIEVTEA